MNNQLCDYRGEGQMIIKINIDDQMVKEIEAIYKAESRSKAIESALRDAIRMKNMEKLKSLIGKIEFDEAAMRQLRDSG
jgi:metal-responsive CopG/Arc/MetJ family transcriptional regulator